jgi:predicted transcriptional regulator
MIRLEQKYEEALQFRKRGFTYSEIAKIVGVSKSTVSTWFAKKAFSKKVRDENARKAARDNVKRMGLLNKTRAGERKTRYADALRSAETEFKHYKKDPLFMAGLMAYVSLGDMKHPSRIRLTSSKIMPHRFFIAFTETYLGISKKDIRFWLLLPSLKSEKRDLAHWSKKLSLPLSSFYPSQMLGGSQKVSQLQHGTGNTIIGNTVLKLRLLRWIELLSKEL